MMTTLASVVVVEQSLEQGPLSSFLTQLVGMVVAVVVELCVRCGRHALCAHIRFKMRSVFLPRIIHCAMRHALRR